MLFMVSGEGLPFCGSPAWLGSLLLSLSERGETMNEVMKAIRQLLNTARGIIKS